MRRLTARDFFVARNKCVTSSVSALPGLLAFSTVSREGSSDSHLPLACLGRTLSCCSSVVALEKLLVSIGLWLPEVYRLGYKLDYRIFLPLVMGMVLLFFAASLQPETPFRTIQELQLDYL